MPYAELCHYEFTSRGREEANEEKLRRWKREQALFMQRRPEFFLGGDPWCVSSRGFEQKEHRKLSSLSIGSAHAF